MQPKAFNEEGIQFAWDQTSIGYAENCLRKYYLVMIEGWRSKSQNDHLKFGGVYATALEHFHKHTASGMDYDEAMIEVVREALISTTDFELCIEPVDWINGSSLTEQHRQLMSGKFRFWESLHNTKTRENLIRTIVWYLEHFRDDPTPTLVLSDGSPAVEHTFAIPVDNDIILTGHLDRMVEYAGQSYIQDQKTTGATLTPRYFSGYTNDNQMLQYTFAGKAVFGLPVKGVMIDAAQIAVGFSRFDRGFVFFDESQLNEWYDHTLWHINLAQQATRENYFPMNRTSCNDYGGCPFREVCNKSPRVRENFLRGEFERGKRWDPLEVR